MVGDPMKREQTEEWPDQDAKDLFEAIHLLRTPEEVEHFFRDLCTLSELEAMAHRWRVARLLDEGLPYQQIARISGASTATVTRVAQWLRRGENGYQLMLERTKRRRNKS
jgi:TrpR-related protein YerC/YecD